MKKILVPLDGTPFSEAVLAPVAEIARATGAVVELLSVRRAEAVRPTRATRTMPEMIPAGTPTGTRLSLPSPAETMSPVVESLAQAVERAEAELRDYLLACAERLPGITTSVHPVVADDPATAIIERARAERVDLIAMATHARSGLAHLVVGSVAERVIRSGVAPVLVVRPSLDARPVPA